MQGMSKNTGTGTRINGKRQCIRPHILRGLFMKIKCILNSEIVVLAEFDNKEKIELNMRKSSLEEKRPRYKIRKENFYG